jgi:hypothetical protein
MIHVLNIGAMGGYNIDPSYTLPAGRNRLLVLFSAGIVATPGSAATYNGVSMTVLTSFNGANGENARAVIAYLEIPDDWSGAYNIAHSPGNWGDILPVTFGGVKKTTGHIADDQQVSNILSGIDRAIESRPSGLVVVAFNAPSKTITTSNLTALYTSSGGYLGYAIPTGVTFAPNLAWGSAGSMAYVAVSFKPKPTYGAVTII